MRICAKAICTRANSNEGEIMQKRKCAKIAFDRKFAQSIFPLEKKQFLRYMCRDPTAVTKRDFWNKFLRLVKN